MRINSLRLMTFLACVGAVGLAPAQETDNRPTDPIEPAGFWVRVTGDDVNLRYRPDLNAMIVSKLEKGAVLRAISEEFGWYRVVPPAGVFSLAHADFIEVSDDGKSGTVRVNENSSLRVRVGSDVVELAPERCEVQARLLRGDKVEIIGRDDVWLRIRPPARVYYALSAEYAERISDEAAAEALRSAPNATASGERHPAPRGGDSALMRRAGDAASEAAPHTARTESESAPSSPDSPAPDVDSATADGAKVTAPIDISGPWGRKLVAVETRIRDLSLESFNAAAWKAVLNDLTPIAVQREDQPIASLASQWYKTVVERLRSSPGGLDGVTLVSDATLATPAPVSQPTPSPSAAGDSSTTNAPPPATAGPVVSTTFTATGEIRLSLAAPIGEFGVRYILIDPATRATTGFVEFRPEARVDPKAIEGQFVGVIGERRFQPGLGRELITATKYALLPRPQTVRPAYNAQSPQRR